MSAVDIDTDRQKVNGEHLSGEREQRCCQRAEHAPYVRSERKCSILRKESVSIVERRTVRERKKESERLTDFTVQSIVSVWTFTDVGAHAHDASTAVLTGTTNAESYERKRTWITDDSERGITVDAIVLPRRTDAAETIFGVQTGGSRWTRIIRTIIEALMTQEIE